MAAGQPILPMLRVRTLGGDTDTALLEVADGTELLRHWYVILTPDGRPFESSEDRYKPGTMAFTLSDTVGELSMRGEWPGRTDCPRRPARFHFCARSLTRSVHFAATCGRHTDRMS